MENDVKRIEPVERPTAASAIRHYNSILERIKGRVSAVVEAEMDKDDALIEIYEIIDGYKIGGKG